MIENYLMYLVYIMQSIKDSTFYIGHTKDIITRVNEHNYGRTGYTKFKRPWKLIYQEEYHTRGEAVIREKYLKSLKNLCYLKKIIGVGP